MARGIMYHITTDPAAVGSMDKYDFTDSLEVLGVDYVENRDGCDAEPDIENLRDILHDDLGISDIKEKPNTEFDIPAFAFQTPGESELTGCKVQFFQKLFQALKKDIERMSLTDFATKTEISYQLMSNIDDRYADAVYLDMGTGPATYTMHQFLRRLIPDTTYYVSANTVLLH